MTGQSGMKGRGGRLAQRLGMLVLGLPFLLGSCLAEELAELRGKVERLESCQQCAQSQLTQGLAIALCKPPVRQLIDDVAQVCKREDVCLDQKIATLVGDADPTHLGKFIAMMDQQRHTVLYFSGKDLLIDGPEGMYTQRLRRLVQPQPPWLPTTKFLVVSNLPQPPLLTGQTSFTGRLSKSDPAVARAESRGLQIIEMLLEFGFPSGQKVRRDMILHWVYSFSPKKGETLRRDDQPLPGTDLSQSVWVFRIDCATPADQPDGGPACQQCLSTAPGATGPNAGLQNPFAQPSPPAATAAP